MKEIICQGTIIHFFIVFFLFLAGCFSLMNAKERPNATKNSHQKLIPRVSIMMMAVNHMKITATNLMTGSTFIIKHCFSGFKKV
jgi:hypothetical protein